MDTTRDVWQIASNDEDGITVTTYSQAADGEPVVEDESRWTWDELAFLMEELSDYEVTEP